MAQVMTMRRLVALFVFVMACFTVSCSSSEDSGSSVRSAPASDQPVPVRTPPTGSENGDPIVNHPDTPEEFDRVFGEYPWELPSSAEVAVLARLGLQVDFSKEQLGRRLAWVEFSSWTAAEQKGKVISFLRGQLQNYAKAFQTQDLTAFAVTTVKLVASNELDVKGSTLYVPKVDIRVDRLSAFVQQMTYFREQARTKTDGILVVPGSVGMIYGIPDFNAYKALLQVFQTKVYPKIRQSLTQNRSLVQELRINDHSAYIEPFEYSNTTRQLEINLGSESIASVDSVLPPYLSRIAGISEALREKVLFRAYIRYSIDGTTKHSYAAALAGLEAIQREEGLLLSCSSRFNRIFMQSCRERLPGDFSVDCTMISAGVETMFLQVAEKDANMEIFENPLSVAQIRENIQKVCAQP